MEFFRFENNIEKSLFCLIFSTISEEKELYDRDRESLTMNIELQEERSTKMMFLFFKINISGWKRLEKLRL